MITSFIGSQHAIGGGTRDSINPKAYCSWGFLFLFFKLKVSPVKFGATKFRKAY